MRKIFVASIAMCFSHTASAGQPDIGIYMWAGKQGVANVKGKFVPFWGDRPKYAVEFADFSAWKTMEGAGGWAIWSWKNNTDNLVMSVPLTVRGTSLADVAAGLHDASFQHLARSLVDNGFPYAVVRIGWEMNAGWYPWGNLNDSDKTKEVAKIATYKAAFAHVTRLFKATSPTFRINWCPAGGWMQVPQPNLYPGDDVVDEIGLDLYAYVWGVEKPMPVQIEAMWQRNFQLDWIAGFAKAHGKPFSFPEFGIGDRPNGKANYGPGDSAAVATYAVDWMRAHAPSRGQRAKAGELAWVGLWNVNAGDYNSQFTDGQRPNIGSVFKAGLGPAATAGPK